MVSYGNNHPHSSVERERVSNGKGGRSYMLSIVYGNKPIPYMNICS
jgi:hypothetical protein